MSKQRGYEGHVSAEYRGRTLYGRFAVQGRIIRVSWDGQQASAQLGDSPPDFLAKIMLLELAVTASGSQEVDPEALV